MIDKENNALDEFMKYKDKIEEVRRLLQNEMAEKGTLTITAASGAGWEAHVMEHYGGTQLLSS